MKQQTKEVLLVGSTIVAVAAFAFVLGFIFGTKKKKQMLVTPKGNLVEREIE